MTEPETRVKQGGGRKAMTTTGALLRNETFQKQAQHAEELTRQFLDYAQSIGCVIGDGALCDSIECTAEQADKLNAWWKGNTQ